MNFALTKELELVRQMVREFAKNELEPVASEIDETEQYPLEIVQKMGKYGLMGIPFSKEYGGAGGTNLAYAISVEEVSKVWASIGIIQSVHTSLCAASIDKYGTEEQKKKYLPALAKGEKVGAFGLTEPNAGTDAAGQQTTAVLNGDHYVLNGQKIFITNSTHAETFVVFAMTDKSKGTKGISAFIVEKGYEGFSIGKVEKKMGIKASPVAELVFEDVKVPVENLLGQEGKGFGIAMSSLDGGRIGVAAQALGIAEGALDQAVAYMKERKQFGKSLDKFQGLAWRTADMDAKIEAARYLVYKAAWNKDNGLPYTLDAARAKLVAAETAMEVTTKALQLLGGYGYTMDYPLERMMRDAKITEIYEGTSEVQRMIISGNLFK